MDQLDPVCLLQSVLQDTPDAADLAQEIEKAQDATDPKQGGNKKRKRPHKSDETPRKRHKKDKKKDKNKKPKKAKAGVFRKRKRDPLFDFDPSLLELPTQEDFSRRYGPSRSSYKWGIAQPAETESPERLIAPPPSIPGAHDDSHDVLVTTPAPRPIVIEPIKKPIERINKPKEQKKTRRERIPVPKFMAMPLEVREEIYRNLLIAERPVLVRAGWARIYERERPGLDTSILRVNKQISREAIRVLYSENVFHYRLRDPPNSGREVVDVQRLAEDGKTDYETDYEDSEEFERGGRMARRYTRRKKETPCDINIPKYGILFRHLIVEAEHNRYSLETQMNMERAINVFTSRPSDGNKACTEDGLPRSTNLHTLAVRITPMTQGDSFTFLDFFKPDSRVLQAMRTISCQFLRFELVLTHLNPTTAHKASRLVMDMRYRRLARRAHREAQREAQREAERAAEREAGREAGREAEGEAEAEREVERNEKADMWRDDRAVLFTRRRQVQASLNALDNIGKTVSTLCHKYSSGYARELHEWEQSFYLDDSYEYEQGFDYEGDVESDA